MYHSLILTVGFSFVILSAMTFISLGIQLIETPLLLANSDILVF